MIVPLLVGNCEVDVPAGSKSGDEIVLRGRGLKKISGTPPTSAPTELSESYRELYREIDTLRCGNLIVRLRITRGFQAWVRGLFH